MSDTDTLQNNLCLDFSSNTILTASIDCCGIVVIPSVYVVHIYVGDGRGWGYFCAPTQFYVHFLQNQCINVNMCTYSYICYLYV